MFKKIVKRILPKRSSVSLAILFGLVRSLFIACDASIGLDKAVDTMPPAITITSPKVTYNSDGEMFNPNEGYSVYENLAWKANFFLPDNINDAEFRALNRHLAWY